MKKTHDRLVRKREEQIERERAEQRREQLVKDEKNYLKSKGKFFGLVFTDNLILVKVIESVAEMQLEGKLMHHCVGSYHKRTDSLILSATIDGKRIETVEVSLTTFKVVQSRGVCNSNTEYHDRIISLVESNAELIRKVTDIFVSLINTLSLSFSEKEIRNSMAKLSENENFGRLFAYGFGAHHLWVAQRMITDPEKVMENRLLIVEF